MAICRPPLPALDWHFAPGSYSRANRAYEILDRLTGRQRQILEYMARGLLNKQIAWRLTIAEKTVKMHRARLLEALGVRTSAEAITLFTEASFLANEGAVQGGAQLQVRDVTRSNSTTRGGRLFGV